MTQPASPYSEEEMGECIAAIDLMSDSSGSIDDKRYERSVHNEDGIPVGPSNWNQELEAIAAALTSDETMKLLEDGPIAVQASRFEDIAHVMVPMRLIRNRADAEEFAQELFKFRDRIPRGGTDIGRAIDASVASLTGPLRLTLCPNAERLVIDIVTDGEPNKPVLPGEDQKTSQTGWIFAEAAANRAAEQNITINMLPVEVENEESVDRMQRLIVDPTLGRIFRADWTNFTDIFKQKFSFDVAGHPPAKDIEEEMQMGLLPAPEATPAAPIAPAQSGPRLASL